VTGGAGFIGSALVHELVGRGESVRVYDNLSTGYRENLAVVERSIEFIEGDLNDSTTLEAALDGVDYVLHQAAIRSVPRSVDDPLLCHRANSDGTLNLLWAAYRKKVRRVVYAGSSSAYGNTPTLPKVETMKPDPLSPYAVAKLSGEQYCRVFTHVYGLETVALRYFSVFGPRQDPGSPYSGVLSLFITALLEGRPLTIHGDGEQTRDFTYVANVVQANLLACTAPQAAAGLVMNVGGSERNSLNRIIELLGQIIGVRPQVTHAPPRAGDVRDSFADIGLARQMLGYQPAVSFEEGLRLTVEWYRQGRAAVVRA
jgi:nucleoside-diphosphate-sugar epimerase